MDIERILADAGYTVMAIAADRQSALEGTNHPDLAFVDINLRDGKTGPSIACELAERGTKVVYVTANPAQIDPIAGTAIGYIRKPFSDSAIRAAAALATADGRPNESVNPEITLFHID